MSISIMSNKALVDSFIASQLIKLREESGLSQKQVAEMSYLEGMDAILIQRKVSRIEKEPLSADSIAVAAYMTAIGKRPQDFFDLLEMGMKKYRSNLSVGMLEMKTVSNEKIKSAINLAVSKLESGHAIIRNSKNPSPIYAALDESFTFARDQLKNLNRKPTIGFFGHYDSGKSSMINVIIGDSATVTMPEEYQPTTNILNLLMHDDDRPTTLTDEPVAVFRRGFKPHMIHDSELVNKYLIGQGDHEFLQDVGQHEYGEVNPEFKDAYIAVVFLSVPILEKLWLLDTPGDMNNDDTDDSNIAIAGIDLVDGLFFLDGVTGFLDKNSFGFFSEILRMKPPVDPSSPMSHIGIFATKAHGVSIEQMNSMKVRLAARYKNQFNDLIFKSWVDDLDRAGISVSENDFNATHISDAISPYARELPELKDNLFKKLDSMSAYLSDHHCKFIEQSAEKVLEALRILMRDKINQTKKMKGSVEQRKKEATEKGARFRLAHSKINIALNKILTSEIPKLKDSCMNDMNILSERLGRQSYIESLINNNYTDKKEASNSIGDHVGQLISSEFETTMKRNGAYYSDKINLAMNNFESELNSEVDGISYSFGDASVDFDAKAAFLGGLTGLSSFGAMSFYAATVAAGSNLGGYILSAKLAGLLVSLGLASSTTAVISTIAALGGPVGIGIAIASLIGLVAWKLFGGSWQEGLAKKVTKSLAKDPFMDRVEPKIEAFWNETIVALKACMINLEVELNKNIKNSNEMAEKEFTEKEVDNWLLELDKILLELNADITTVAA